MTREEGLKRILDGNFRNEYGFDIQIMVDCMGLTREILQNLEKEYIPLSVLEDIKAELPRYANYQSIDGQDLILATDIATLIDKYIKPGDKE